MRASPGTGRAATPLACVMNVSEGRSRAVVARLVAAGGDAVLDVHSDPHHHRSVLWLAGEEAARAVAAEAVAHVDLRRHAGAHPRGGAVDVVPFVPVVAGGLEAALAARDAFVEWVSTVLRVPAFRYGPERSLPALRRGAFRSLRPDAGPLLPHPTAGAVAVGARHALVAYNVWLARPDLAAARAVARDLRGPSVRALGLRVGERVQVSMNLVDPDSFGPADAYDAVAARAAVAGAELVGLLPDSVLRRVDPDRWAELDLSADRTVEARLGHAD